MFVQGLKLDNLLPRSSGPDPFEKRSAEDTLRAASTLSVIDQLSLTPEQRNSILEAMSVQGAQAAGKKTGHEEGRPAYGKTLRQAVEDVPLAALKFLVIPELSRSKR